MSLSRRSLLWTAVGSVAFNAFADTYPSRPIRLIVPYAPGGSIDFAGRTLGKQLSAELGQPFVIENIGGGGGLLGTSAVARSQPDGYTLGIGVGSTMTIPIAMGRKMTYDPVKDLTAIGIATNNLFCIVVRSDFPAKNLKELVEQARRNPQKIHFSTSGHGTSTHLEGERLNQFAGIDMVHVPYKGASPAMADLLAGQVEVGVLSVTPVVPYVQTGKLRVLAVLDNKRFGPLPDAPAAPEALPGYSQEVPSWLGLVGPAGLPAPIVARLNAALGKAVRDPATEKAMEANGMSAVASTPQQFAAQLKRDIDVWTKVVQERKILIE